MSNHNFLEKVYQNKSYSDNFIMWLVLCYVLALPITNFEFIPFVENKIQIPELIFLILFSLIVLKRQWIFFRIRNKPFTVAVSFYILIGLSSYLLNQEREILVEVIKVSYLFVSYLIITNSLINGIAYKTLVKYIIYGGVVFSIGAILSWSFATIFNSRIFLADYYEGYPFLGNIYRAKFLTYTPTMFGIFLSICIFFEFDNFFKIKTRKPTSIVIILILFTSLILTFSKTILILIPSLFLLYFYYYKPRTSFLKVSSFIFFIICFLMFNFFSHFSIVNNSGEIKINNTKYLVNEKILEFDNYEVVKNSYLLLKENAMKAFNQSKMVGIGLGRFDNYLETQEAYPSHLINYDPHSTYFGVLAELGILGSIALCLFILSIFRMMDKNFIPYIGIFILFLCEGIVTDMMNVRHLWLIISLLTYLQSRCLERS